MYLQTKYPRDLVQAGVGVMVLEVRMVATDALLITIAYRRLRNPRFYIRMQHVDRTKLLRLIIVVLEL